LRIIAKLRAGFADVGLAMPDIACAELTELRLSFTNGLPRFATYDVSCQAVTQRAEQVIERGAVAHGDVVDLVQGGLDCRVAALLAMAVFVESSGW